MKILIACEKSGIIREAFKARGFDAWSCDIEPTEIPGQHLQCDIMQVLGDGWDLMIAHPECRYLCFSGERWMTTEPGREELREKAFEFFLKMCNAPIPRIAVENSHSVFLNKNYRRPDQTIHPYHFGDAFKKATCLWLKGLPPLMPTNILPVGHRHPAAWLESSGENQSRNRAKTYQGIANAIAEQWGNVLLSGKSYPPRALANAAAVTSVLTFT